MFGFSKDQLEQNKQEIAAIRDSIMSAMKDMMGHVSTENAITRKMVTDFVAEEKAKVVMDERTVSQQDVIESGGGGGGGAAFTIRYRNDTATSNEADIHRLEWIAQPTAIDTANYPDYTATGDYAADHPYMWADELWTPVVGGEAVQYVPAG